MIRDFWVIEKISGRCLLERCYTKKTGGTELIPMFLSALTSFSDSGLKGDRISALETKGTKWIYRYADPLIFVVTGAKSDSESHLKAQVSYLSSSFLEMFPHLRGAKAETFLKSWSGASSDFKAFEAVADQLVQQWGEIGGVIKGAKALDVLEIYQKIFDAIFAKIPSRNNRLWFEFKPYVEDFGKRCKASVSYDFSGARPVMDLIGVDVFSANYETVKKRLGLLLTQFVEILKKHLPAGEAREIIRSGVIPLMKTESRRIDAYGLNRFLVSIL